MCQSYGNQSNDFFFKTWFFHMAGMPLRKIQYVLAKYNLPRNYGKVFNKSVRNVSCSPYSYILISLKNPQFVSEYLCILEKKKKKKKRILENNSMFSKQSISLH